MNAMTMVYARYLAQQRVKKQLRDAGFKLSSIERRDLVSAASAYIAAHPEILIEAAEKVEATPSLKKTADQYQRWQERWRARRAKLSSAAQVDKGCSINTIPVQNSRS